MKIKKEDCPRGIDLLTATEDFSNKSDATVTCTRCGASAHDPSLLCSPDVTLASSTPLRDSGSSLSSQSQSDFSGQQSQSGFSGQQSQSGFSGQQGQSSQSQSQSQSSQSQTNLRDQDVDLGD